MLTLHKQRFLTRSPNVSDSGSITKTELHRVVRMLNLKGMDIINVLPDDLLVKILSFVPTKVAVSTSILSKRWEFLWKWVPKIEYDASRDITDMNRSSASPLRYRDFINKNLLLHKAPIIESLRLRSSFRSIQAEDIELWIGMAVSRFLRELSIDRYFAYNDEPRLVLPSSLYTCKTLVTLNLAGTVILVDVPQKCCLPSLKTLKLRHVTYANEDYLRLLLSYCPVLEDLFIKRHKDDNVKELVVIVPSLQRLSLEIDVECSSDELYVIDTPSLKYFKVVDHRYDFSYAIRHMPKLEEADIFVAKDLQEFLDSITSAKRLSLQVYFNNDLESMYNDGVVFNHLERLKLRIHGDYWSKLLVRLLNDSPKLQVLNLKVDHPNFKDYERLNWSNERSSVPKSLLESLDTFEFTGYEERDFLSFISKKAHRLNTTPILELIM